MNKKNLKLIMELIFIFIFPIAFMLISVKSEVVNTYDENGNLLTTEKIFDFSEDTILRDYNDNLQYINYLNYNNNYNILNNNNIAYDPINFTINVKNLSPNYNFNNDDYLLLSFNQSVRNHYFYIKIISSNSSFYLKSYYNDAVYYVNNSYVINNISPIIALGYNNAMLVGIYDLKILCIDLTIMFGSGYEPTKSDFEVIMNDFYYDYSIVDSIELIYYSNDIISSDYEYNYTWYSKLFNELYDDLQINNNIVLKLITTYIILWVIMFLVWHLLYRFIDFMVHLFDRKE